MTIQEFKNKYLGKQVEYHSFGVGAYNQCVDLVNQYINEVLDNKTKDYTEIIGTNAKDFNTKYDKEDFDFIANTPNGVPQLGDIIIWNGNVGGGVGHVAIFLEGDINSFKSLDQNWSQKERVTLETHSYKNVSGWLRPRNFKPDQSSNELQACQTDRDTNWNCFNFLCGLLGIEVNASDKEATKKRAGEAITDLQVKAGQVSTLEQQVSNHAQEIEVAVNQAKTILENQYNTDREQWAEGVKQSNIRIGQLERRLKEKYGDIAKLPFNQKIKILFGKI